MKTVTEEIDSYIKENGGDTRDALNIALLTIKNLRIELELLKINQPPTGSKK